MQLHEFVEAQADLFAAARLDPQSKDIREALACLKGRQEAARNKDAKFAGKSLGVAGMHHAGGQPFRVC